MVLVRRLFSVRGPITAVHHEGKGATKMASNSKQGIYLGMTMVGFTAFPAGLVQGGGLGKVIAVIGIALLAFSIAGFYRIKGLA